MFSTNRCKSTAFCLDYLELPRDNRTPRRRLQRKNEGKRHRGGWDFVWTHQSSWTLDCLTTGDLAARRASTSSAAVLSMAESCWWQRRRRRERALPARAAATGSHD
ncbi:hypothetical protein ACA910_010361 [Epithemia clementina (nom. ined.)]